jgi:hypothetical protein
MSGAPSDEGSGLSLENSVLQTLQFQEVSVRRILRGGTGISHYRPNQGFVNRKVIFVFTRLLLNREEVLKYVRKALATVLSVWSLTVILLSKVTPRYVILFTKGVSRPFSCNTSSGTLSLLEKYIAWVFPSSIFMFHRSHHEFSVRESHVTTDSHSVSPSWCRAPSGAHDHILITV